MIPHGDARIGRGVEHHFAVGLADGEDDHSHFGVDLHAGNGRVDERAAGRNAHLLDVDLHVQILGGEIDELLNVRLQQRLRHAMAGAVIRSEHKIGARAAQLLFRRLLCDARRERDLRVQRPRRENQKQVVRVGRQRGDQALRAVDADFAQHLVAARVGQHGEHSLFDGSLYFFLVIIDNDELRALLPQLIRRAAAHPAEAADDEVAV